MSPFIFCFSVICSCRVLFFTFLQFTDIIHSQSTKIHPDYQHIGQSFFNYQSEINLTPFEIIRIGIQAV